jgi:hypothetical protein
MTEPAVTRELHTPNFGIIVGAAIVLAILVFGGLFFWGKSANQGQQLNVEDVGRRFEVTTSHIDEPNMTDAEIEAAQKATSAQTDTQPTQEDSFQ